MGFNLPFYVQRSQLAYDCMINNATNQTDWMYTKLDGSVAKEMPQCLYVCDREPLNNPKLYNRTWVPGTFTVGTKATYNCPGKSSMRLHFWHGKNILQLHTRFHF